MPRGDPEAQAAYLRQWKRNNPEKVAENARRWFAENPDKVHEANRRWASRNPDKRRASRARCAHGADYAEVFAALWDEQNGRCYLCERPLAPGQDTVIDHDHTCCPATRSCSYCRRGLACRKCNALIGAADDDPGLLQIIAYNLESVAEATRARIAAKPAQLTLD
ncbi:MAG TPA: endonuclease domain-containing protein [Streptosporangiaceae bacterium]